MTNDSNSGMPSESVPPPVLNADRKQLAQRLQQLRREIVQAVLGNDPDVTSPLVAEIRGQRSQVQNQIAKRQDRVHQIIAAKAQYVPLEKADTEALKHLTAAESQFAGLTRPLGHAVFQAWLTGETANQAALADRIALHERIKGMQKEYQELATRDGATFVQKTKAKAQQLLIAGKIKVEELKIGSHETQVGKSLLESAAEQTTACLTTATILDQVCQQRATIANLRSAADAAKATLDAKKQELCGSLGFSSINGVGTFDAEIRACEGQLGQWQKELAALESGIPDRLATAPVGQAALMAGLLDELRKTQEQMALLSHQGGARAAIESAGTTVLDKTRQLSRTTLDAANTVQARKVLEQLGTTWRNLGKRRKAAIWAITGGTAIIALFLGLHGRGGAPRAIPADDHPPTIIAAEEQPNHMQEKDELKAGEPTHETGAERSSFVPTTTKAEQDSHGFYVNYGRGGGDAHQQNDTKATESSKIGAQSREELFNEDDGPSDFSRQEWTILKRRLYFDGCLGEERDEKGVRFKYPPDRFLSVFRAMRDVFDESGFSSPTANQIYNGVKFWLGSPPDPEGSVRLRTIGKTAKGAGIPLMSREDFGNLNHN